MGLQPVAKVKPFVVTVPANTVIAAPTSTDLSFNPAEVIGLELIIPPGHNGQTGIAIAQAGTPVLPDDHGDFIVGDGEKIEWPLYGFLDTGDWSAVTYNLATIPHSFYVRFLLEVIDPRGGVVQYPGPLQLQ